MQDYDKLSGDQLLAKLEDLSNDGDESASMVIGELLFGKSPKISRDEKRACDMFERFHTKYSEAAHNFATCFYRKSSGRKHDYARARKEYRRAIEMGWKDSSCALGNMLIEGQGGNPDIQQGLALCLVAAEKGVAHAQTDYGTYFLTGKFVRKDAVKARLWLDRAAKQSHPNAAYLLAQIHLFGDGTKKDGDKATYWFEIAHEKGRFDAAYQLGLIYLAKLVVDIDGEQRFYSAYFDDTMKWLQIASSNDPNIKKRQAANELIAAIDALKAASDDQGRITQ